MSGKKLVLYVEDNLNHAELVLRCFESHGAPCRVDHVEDGAAALDYLGRSSSLGRKPCLILLDLRLPKVDGLDVLRSVKSTPELAEIPVVIFTTSASESDVARAYERHANSYLQKPTDLPSLDLLMRDLKTYWLSLNELPAGSR